MTDFETAVPLNGTIGILGQVDCGSIRIDDLELVAKQKDKNVAANETN